MIYAYVAIFLFGGALARKQNALCPNVTRPEFDIEAFMGRWYIAAEFPTDGNQCKIRDYYLDRDDIYYSRRFQRRKQSFSTVLEELPTNRTTIEKEILETDYTSYAVMYKTTPHDNESEHSSPDIKILTRHRYITAQALGKAFHILKCEFGNIRILYIDQGNCKPHYIDKTVFQGKWHIVAESQPDGNQCKSREYFGHRDKLYYSERFQNRQYSRFTVNGGVPADIENELIKTNYISYAVIWKHPYPDEPQRSPIDIKILTKDIKPTEEVLTKARDVIKQWNLKNFELTYANQSICILDVEWPIPEKYTNSK